MVELRQARPEEAGVQQALWQEAFGDGDADIALFYRHCWRPEDVSVLVEDGRLISMSAALPQTLALPGGAVARGYYIYAVCTAAAARGRGYGQRLLRYQEEVLRGRGAEFATLVPAEPGLHRFFAQVDYTACFYTWRLTMEGSRVGVPAPGDLLSAAEPEEYGRIRTERLAGLPAAGYPPEQLRFQQGMCRLTGGDLYRLTVNGVEGCAAAERAGGGHVVVKELLIPPEGMAGALSLLAARLPASSYEIRAPLPLAGLPGGEAWAFGMIRWYSPEQHSRWGTGVRGYLGLGFD